MTDIGVALIGIVITLILQLLAGVWWAATMTSEVKHLNTNVRNLSQNAEIHHAEQAKTVNAICVKHDDLDKRLIVIETKCLKNHEVE